MPKPIQPPIKTHGHSFDSPIWISNFNFELWIMFWKFEFYNSRWYEHQRRGISLNTESFVCCNRNAIFFAWKISRAFADQPSKTLISKVKKFYTSLTMIIQKNRRVRISSRNLMHFAIRCHPENIWVLELNIADSNKYIHHRWSRNFNSGLATMI